MNITFTLSQLLDIVTQNNLGFLCHGVAILAKENHEIPQEWQQVGINGPELRAGLREIAPELFDSDHTGGNLLDLWVNWPAIIAIPDFKHTIFEDGGAIQRNHEFRVLLLQKMITDYGDHELTVTVRILTKGNKMYQINLTSLRRQMAAYGGTYLCFSVGELLDHELTAYQVTTQLIAQLEKMEPALLQHSEKYKQSAILEDWIQWDNLYLYPSLLALAVVTKDHDNCYFLGANQFRVALLDLLIEKHGDQVLTFA
jgi:hypothetical protein